MDPVFTLAQGIVDIGYEDLPLEVVEVTKKDILDILATAVAGSTTPGSGELAELVQEWGGKEESSIIAFGGKVPAPNACLVNGTLPRAIDYEDTLDASGHHAGTAPVPAVLAIAERRGEVTGKELIAATAMGLEVTCRLGLSSKWVRSWSYTSLYGLFGAAAAAGKLLGLDKEKMVDTLGIAFEQAAWSLQCVLDGSMLKGIISGFAAKAAVMAALMAEKGITGPKNIFEGEIGLYNLYLRGEYNPVPLTSKLGQNWELLGLSFKPYPCCRLSHSSVDAVLEILSKNDIAPEDIDEVTVLAGKNAQLLCEPIERKKPPQNVVDAQFSLPYIVATALVKKGVGIADFTPEAIKDPQVIGICQRVTTRMAPELDEGLGGKAIEPAVVEVKTKGKQVYSNRIDIAKGDPMNPLSFDDIAEKFRDCVRYSVRPLSRDNTERAIDTVRRLEEVKDASRLVQLVC